MQSNKSVLIVGVDPRFLDFSSPELAPLNLSAEEINVATMTVESDGHPPFDASECAGNASDASSHGKD